MIYATAVLAMTGLISSVSAKPLWSELHSYNFEKFVRDFRHPWENGSDEFQLRKGIFDKELERIRKHNEDPQKTWKEGVNKFSAMTKEERRSFYGRAKYANDHHKPKHEIPFPHDLKMKTISELPKNVDWRNAGVVTAVKDQGYCGSCWAFCSAATLESHVALATGLLYDLSPQQIAMCTPNPDSCGGTGGCQGATSELAFEYVAQTGIVQEYQIGYQAYFGKNSDCAFTNATAPVAHIEGYVKLPENNYLALMNAVAQVGPVSIAVDAGWGGYESGIFDGCDQETPDINHGVVLVGYGEEESGAKYWLVRNSWSPSWGEEGYIRLARSDNEQEKCGMDTTPQDGTACAGDDTPKKVCGTCGILFDGAYPTGISLP